MLVLTWNLFHGRSVPDAPREQLADFAARLAGWEWDVALLQEVPPWWPPELGRACGASARTALTSRNWVLSALALGRAAAPGLIKSWGGGANAILVRGEAVGRAPCPHAALVARAARGARRAPGARLVGLQPARPGALRGERAGRRRAGRADRDAWSAGAPVVLGGDLNRATRRAPGFEAMRPATASTTSSRDRCAPTARGVRWIGAGSRTTRRCWRTLPRKDRSEEAS